MASLIRWDPFREMMSMQRAFDRMYEEARNESSERSGSFWWELPVDVSESDEGYTVKASLPGVKPEDINITFNNGALTIQAETHAEEEKTSEHFLLRERRYGSYARSISLPGLVDSSKIDASFDNGILSLRLPKAEEVKPKRIQVQASSPKVVEAHAGNGTR